MSLGGYPAGVTDGSFDRPDAQPYCSQCGLLVDGDCHCGETALIPCPNCAHGVEPLDWLYCPYCGEVLHPETLPPTEETE